MSYYRLLYSKKEEWITMFDSMNPINGIITIIQHDKEYQFEINFGKKKNEHESELEKMIKKYPHAIIIEIITDQKINIPLKI